MVEGMAGTLKACALCPKSSYPASLGLLDLLQHLSLSISQIHYPLLDSHCSVKLCPEGASWSSEERWCPCCLDSHHLGNLHLGVGARGFDS